MQENPAGPSINKNSSVLITGGSGLIGRYLTSSLQASGYNVSILSRTGHKSEKTNGFMWDPDKKMIDPEAFEGIDFIIHLAGANIGSKRWSGKRKEVIIKSRVDSARLLYKTIVERGIRLKAFISASATGIYGSDTSQKIFTENDQPADDFLGSVCKKWETAADLFNNSGIRTVKIRSGVVLEKNDSALSKLVKPGKFGFLVKTGTGQQYMPWIHIADLCDIYLKALNDNTMSGAYNAVSPQHITHSEFMHILGKVMNLPVLPVPIPPFMLRAVFGEMSSIILKGSRVSSEKLTSIGYRFQFGSLEDALCDILK